MCIRDRNYSKLKVSSDKLLETFISDSEIMYFSNLSLEESAKDDIRFKSNYWDPWEKYSPEIYE